ncbi:hypothetical protein WR25_24492 [Diploscapter pachys]|uniref:Uncharacterized protein n=1 Tax=Diploscapter pachys TaxID=2018661 RepID=A0A2A2KHD8_9BILA|nr:hypothetical protein WR25_24492 [Diploscapter pachys]
MCEGGGLAMASGPLPGRAWPAVLAAPGLARAARFTRVILDHQRGQRRRLLCPGTCGLLQVADHAPDPVGEFFRAEALAKALDHQRKGERCGAPDAPQLQRQRLQALQGLAQALHIQFLAQHLLAGLGQQQVVRVVLPEHIEVQPAGSLQLARALRRTGVAGEHQPGDPGDLAKAPARQLAGIEAGQYLGQQVLAVEQRRGQGTGVVDGAGAQQFQAVVVDRDGETQRRIPGQAPGQQAGQAQVHRAPGEWIEKQVPALAGLQGLGQQDVFAGQRRPGFLHLQQRAQQAHFRALVHPLVRRVQLGQHRFGQFARERHAPAVPARDRGLAVAGAAHVDGHVAHFHQLKRAASEQEVVARAQAGDEAFLDAAQRSAAAAGPELHGVRRAPASGLRRPARRGGNRGRP